MDGQNEEYRNMKLLQGIIVLYDKSHNLSKSYPTMYHFISEISTSLLQKDASWDMGLVHCAIYATGLLRSR